LPSKTLFTGWAYGLTLPYKSGRFLSPLQKLQCYHHKNLLESGRRVSKFSYKAHRVHPGWLAILKPLGQLHRSNHMEVATIGMMKAKP
jgi:hypothetical protein